MDYFMDIDALLSEPGSRSFVFFEENANVMDAVKLLVSMYDYSCTDVSIWRQGKDVSEIYSTPGYYDR